MPLDPRGQADRDLAIDEIQQKLALVWTALEQHGLAGVRLRGVDWFAWATAGGSNVVLLASEVGVAQVLITRDGIWVLTNEIEAERLRAEELPATVDLWAGPWADPAAMERQVRLLTAGGLVASDRPAPGEQPLPPELVRARRRLLPEEIARYRQLGRDAAEAMTATLMAARPDWTEQDLAGAGAAALWRRGIHPALTLVGGARRLPLYRHATPKAEPLGDRAMLVFCGRRHGLYANLTRFVSFCEPTAEEQVHLSQVARVEQAAWAASRPGQTVGAAYTAIVRAYAAEGHAGAERAHHQGGTTGYLSREVLGRPAEPTEIETATALAWNPSLPGTKLEDTILVSHAGAEILTVDPLWPTFSVNGHARPAILVRR